MNFFGGYNIYKEPFTVTWYDKIPLPIRRAIGAVADLLPPVHGINFWCAAASRWRSVTSATPT